MLSVVTLLLIPKLNQPLTPKLKALKPAPVVSHTWDIGFGWEPDETRDVNSLVVRLRMIR